MFLVNRRRPHCSSKLLRTLICSRSGPSSHIVACNLKKDVSSPFPDTYESSSVEKGWYKWWRDQGYFQPKTDDSWTFSLVLPPPNVTGTLHLGHALTCVVQDALCRWHRMRGHSVVWVPGSDHAGIATQIVVERALEKRGTSREKLGRKEFLQEVHKWKEEKGNIIFQQLETLGASLDWKRQCFTMSKEHNQAVNVAFKELYERGLIYRDQGLVNWSCHLGSAISDIEVEHMSLEKRQKLKVPGYDRPVEFGVLYDIAYRLTDSDESIVVSTTRPETILGDVAVAVHPDDARYSHFVGRKLRHPLRQRQSESAAIPVIADESVRPDFGTGAVKITPAHDFGDFEVARRHRLPVLSIIDDKGRVCLQESKFQGLPRFEARWKVLEELKQLDLFRGNRSHSMQVPICSRSGDVIEPMIKHQWYLRCDEMAAKALEASEKRELKFDPEQYHAVWQHWLENIKDWCLSRQLWWGHQIPMFLCTNGSGEETWVCAFTPEEALQDAVKHFAARDPSQIIVRQEEDVLDTWFSSAIIPFANFGWPNKDHELNKFYPLSLMETGHDILFFWVARMVWLGVELTGKLPFSDVLLHGMICDSQGRKMSKSRGNVIDPLHIVNGFSRQELENDVIESSAKGLFSNHECDKALADIRKDFPQGIPVCGTDALRFGLCYYDVKSQHIKLDLSIMKSSSAFCNKIWQAARYLGLSHQRAAESGVTLLPLADDVSHKRPEDAWIVSKCAITVQEMNHFLEAKDFHLATRSIRRFMYSNLCDVYLEATKPILSDPNHPDFGHTFSTLHLVIVTGLKLLHPLMPFVTEELYQRMPLLQGEHRKESIMIEEYPLPDKWSSRVDERLMENVEIMLEVASAIRNLKKSFNLRRNVRPEVVIYHPVENGDSPLHNLLDLIQVLSVADKICLTSQGDICTVAKYAMASVRGVLKVFVNVEGLFDVEQEIVRNTECLKKTVSDMTKVRERNKKKASCPESDLKKIEVLEETARQLEEQIRFLHKCKREG